jgi:transcription-repair coupling factor (superfamily II helicase)
VDILIGTHRILQPDVRFADLGLVIIDEEQRFGVEHKERLKRLRAEVDVLTMTATPIPRTLHMALLGLRDISSLATPPVDRRAVRTEVRVYDEERVREAIEFEIARGGQVYYVCPRIETAEAALDRLRALVPGAAIALAHGQMDAERLERTMLAFLEREIEVLVATTIVESGLDIPAANTLIVEDADRFGLADLHQLRGRVGRWKRQAYALFLVPRDRPVTPNAWRRLKAIEEFSELGAGFRIALRDLEIRGAGNLLGKEQSGHIAAVGYEMYCALLEQAVREVQGQGISPQWPEPKIEVPGAFGVPANYVPDAPARMEVYRLIARARTEEAVEEARRRIEDRFGRIPAEVAELLRRARWRCRARARGVLSLSVAGGIVQVRLAAGGNPEWLKRSGARCFEDGTWWLPAGHDPASTVERLLSA